MPKTLKTDGKGFCSFQDALDFLEIEEEDLRRLIAAGVIRALREDTAIRLRAESVERVDRELGVQDRRPRKPQTDK